MTFKKLKIFLASPKLLHWTLPVLMLYLIVGTIAQKYISLYEATQIFFSDWIIWLGPVPVPGYPVIMLVLCANLAGKLVFSSPWTRRNAGNIITHIGAILLLAGGVLTSLFSTEGYIDVAEGESQAFVSDYNKRELVVFNKDGTFAQSWMFDDLAAGQILPIKNIALTVLDTCRNCEIVARQKPDESFMGMAQHMQLKRGELAMADEENLSGVTFELQTDAGQQTHIVLENVPQLPEFEIGEQTYQTLLRRQRRDLPFKVTLLDFIKETHPGTSLAKSYKSRVLVEDDHGQWETLISMNNPLRYKGYTLYQSNYIRTSQGDVSVFSVVENIGRSFPYISGIVLCIGLLVHLIVRRRSA